MAKKFEEGKVLNKEILDKLRDIEGFPLGEDEDIIKLSAPPYYTACPNPFINDFIEEFGKPYDEETDDYHREPFAADVSEGKNHPIYNAHSYHTKVPHKAIMRYILHYTEPGDIVFDGFCGTGMTGVAAQMCGNPEADLEFKLQLEKEMPYIKWGSRKAILNDLSPAATFIAHNYNTPVDVEEFEKEANRILDECEKELGWMYETNHVDENGNQIYDMAGPVKGKINYTIWSDVLICPNCSNDINLWDVAVDNDNGTVSDSFTCNNCKANLKKNECDKAMELIYDEYLKTNVYISKQVPVLINYFVGKKRFEKKPDKFDFDLIKKIESMKLKTWYPTDRMIVGSESRRNDKDGITNVHYYYTKRNLAIMSCISQKSNSNSSKFLLTASLVMGTKMSRYGKRTGNLSGTLYIPSLIKELNMFEFISRKLHGGKGILKPLNMISKFKSNDVLLQTSSLGDMRNIAQNSIDYIFTDPPFGANLNYSELNFLWESWLKVITNNEPEAIVNNVQGKGLVEYQSLMTQCFKEYYRVLKPNRWMTVEFSNSKNSVWNAIQESLVRAGFIIADVRVLDKKQGSFKQVNYSSAVKQDLVISAYKPREGFVENFIKKAGTEESVWDFVREHLEKLPVVIERGTYLERVAERDAHSLFDRMIAYHVVNGVSIPLDIQEFFRGLDERFIKRDNMYFLPDQVNEYDNARIKFDLPEIQFSLFVEDEKSALAWLYYQLDTPQTYSELQPKFMKEAKPARHEKMPELIDLLQENFLQDDEEKWYIPDITKSGDIQKLREKKLLKEFEEYLNSKGKLKRFRTEAIRVGFAKLWKEKNYKLIVKMGDRIPENVLQEDDKLLMYYDISSSRID
ncbi:DNA methyltransferase [Sporanaerobacter sp. PP17-6a]|jgi:DNA modification methylase|uniref:DNA methyltransferase n=1 Tax=Sporanaerobacter sp. PP17-6a TaxID=1891289 RepID=UPI0008A00531|nr:DNA methyltransferase [Sporanaerobacter sp. PP17-6a]SCL81632.1 putative methyltransferase [Sporanaerobacter sp. PP17-6a]